jgi:hypothetical protein
VTEISWNAVGSFSGWRHVFPDDEQVASAARAKDLVRGALAMHPGSAARALLQALVYPLDAQAICAASCTDASTGVPLEAERGVRYADAYPVAA